MHILGLTIELKSGKEKLFNFSVVFSSGSVWWIISHFCSLERESLYPYESDLKLLNKEFVLQSLKSKEMFYKNWFLSELNVLLQNFNNNYHRQPKAIYVGELCPKVAFEQFMLIILGQSCKYAR